MIKISLTLPNKVVTQLSDIMSEYDCTSIEEYLSLLISLKLSEYSKHLRGGSHD